MTLHSAAGTSLLLGEISELRQYNSAPAHLRGRGPRAAGYLPAVHHSWRDRCLDQCFQLHSRGIAA